MSHAKQRVAIAYDVLAQIKMKKYHAEPMTYVEVPGASDKIDDSDGALDLQKVLLSNSPDCNVCGLGAAFCSMARLGDEVDLADGDGYVIHKTLKPIFGMHQIGLIEYAFEGHDAADMQLLSENEEKACGRFFKKRPDDDKRLAAIFRNIIKNNGTFKP